ncbi:unnamed protein product [Protopolystoma xenopodis]|uniref:Uncharacterized protein n=1 Tax=Protopolystoma xenopodis TaxID=117903 RepID=A0A3S5B482_9PLAT|nr:unnamed protein product [Protopolystoma xenopodis]
MTSTLVHDQFAKPDQLRKSGVEDFVRMANSSWLPIMDLVLDSTNEAFHSSNIGNNTARLLRVGYNSATIAATHCSNGIAKNVGVSGTRFASIGDIIVEPYSQLILPAFLGRCIP